jgi:hypothetical protein
VLDDLGIASFYDLRRCHEVKSFLPPNWDLAEAIIVVNPEIEEDGAPAHRG